MSKSDFIANFSGVAEAHSASSSSIQGSRLAERMTDGYVVDGMRLVTMPMAIVDVVTVYGSFYGGDIFSPGANNAIASMTSSMLDKGTRKRDKFAISEKLESVGARVSFDSDDYRVSFSARCLKEHVPLVVEMLAEQLCEPAFSEDDLVSLQRRVVGNLRRQSENTDYQARVRFSQLAYPHNHPNHLPSIEQQIHDVEEITVRNLSEFHEQHYGRGNLVTVVTGDLERSLLEECLGKYFENWQVVALTPPSLDGRRGYCGLPPVTEVVTMKAKASVDLIMGHVVGIDREHPDYLALNMGSYIFGGNFSARLMTAVRDEEGLTYGIGSSVSGASDGKDGYWSIQGTFAPGLLEQGKTSSLSQLKKWVKQGVTEEELAVKKTTLAGNYKVGLATTSGMATTILDMLERGKSISYIDEYLDEVNALTLEKVNGAIREYIKSDQLITVAAGSIDDEWKSLVQEQG